MALYMGTCGPCKHGIIESICWRCTRDENGLNLTIWLYVEEKLIWLIRRKWSRSMG